MTINIFKTANLDEKASVAVIASKDSVFDVSFLTVQEYNYVKQCIEKGENYIVINQYHRLVSIAIIDPKKSESILLEDARKAGYKL